MIVKKREFEKIIKIKNVFPCAKQKDGYEIFKIACAINGSCYCCKLYF